MTVRAAVFCVTIKTISSMKETEYSVRMLVPEEGHLLTQSSPDIAMARRVVAEEVALAAGESPDDWKEITAEEGEALRREIFAATQEEFMQAQAEAEAQAAGAVEPENTGEWNS